MDCQSRESRRGRVRPAVRRGPSRAARARRADVERLEGRVLFDGAAGPGEELLVAAGSTARYVVPANGSLGTAWTARTFNDLSWSSGPTGIGFGQVTTPVSANAY